MVDFQQSDDGHVTLGLKQVEINTVSTSLAGHGYKMNLLHKLVTFMHLFIKSFVHF